MSQCSRPMGLEQAQELRNSPYWKWVEDELDYRIMSGLNELRKASRDDVGRLQYKLDMLEQFKRLPDDVVDREADPDTDQPEI